jgi:hypothetical protein
MPTNEIWVAESTAAATSSAVDVVERPSVDKFTSTTADPGAAGVTLAVTLGTSTGKMPQVNGFKVRVLGTSGVPEIMLVTAGAGTNSWTVTRGQDGTAGVTHSVGATVSLMVGVQRVEPVLASKVVSYKGRASTFRTPGRAGTAGQKLFALHNATGSTVIVDIEKITVDLVQTVIKAVTVLPPVIRAWRFTAVPTNGTVLSKVPEDTTFASNSAVTVWGDAASDGTGSGTTLTITLPAGNIITEEFAPRLITAVGYEPLDRATFFEDEAVAITLRPLEGLCIFADYVLATQNPATDMWIVGARWTEYRNA